MTTCDARRRSSLPSTGCSAVPGEGSGRFAWRLLLAAFGLAMLPAAVLAQGTKADYERSDGWAARVQDKVFRTRVKPEWIAGGNAFWYRVRTGVRTSEYVLAFAESTPDAASPAAVWRKEPLFDPAKLAAALSEQARRKVSAADFELEAVSLPADLAHVDFRFAGSDWRWDRRKEELVRRKPEDDAEAKEATPQERNARDDAARRPRRGGEGAARRGTSPDGTQRAFVRDHQLWVKKLPDGPETPLSQSGKEGDDFSLGEVYWSPDSKHLAALRTKRAAKRTVHIVESSPKDQLQPKLHSFPYAKPGDEIDHPRVVLFDVDPPRERVLEDALFPNPWSIDHCRWRPDGSEFLFLYNQRGHQTLRLIAADRDGGACRTVIDETSRTFVDYNQKLELHFLDETNEVVWASERDGWNHLYLYDLPAGAVKRQLTHGDWLVRKVLAVDPEKRQAWIEAGGIHPDQDPYHLHLVRVGLDDGSVVPLTAEDGSHQTVFSPDRSVFVDTWSRADLPPVTVLRRGSDGALLLSLEAADDAELRKTGWRPPTRFTAKGRDGKTPIYGLIFFPSNYDSAKKHPILEDIYAGPHGAFVPKAFSAFHEAQRNAELGFVVVKIDGMGTNFRSKAFHDVCWKNLGDSGFPDRILWIQAAAKEHPGMDLSRVGLYGGSAGGQSTLRGLLAHGEFYKAGVAFCGCHDNRMDKIWWNELWMGWPVGPHYAEQSNVTQARRLQGKLLLVVGEMDKNVDPASTMQVVDALVKADKDFDLLVIPGAGHGNGGAYGHRRCVDFFVRHLWGAEPRR